MKKLAYVGMENVKAVEQAWYDATGLNDAYRQRGFVCDLLSRPRWLRSRSLVPPRRHLKRVFLAVQFLDVDGDTAAACKQIEQIGDDLSCCFLRRRIPRMGSPEKLRG